MAGQDWTCPDCGDSYSLSDNYCRRCGMYLAAVQPVTAVVTREERALEVQRPALPAPVKRAATAVAIGAALQLGLGLAGRYLAAQAGQKAVRAALPTNPVRARQRDVPAPADDQDNGGVSALSETVFIRRIWVRAEKR
jgi:hypothetical protein